MTGGTVAILGEVGDNFGAGFTGGMAFVYDRARLFEKRLNPETLHWQRLDSAYWENVLKTLIARHVAETESRYAATLLNDWGREAAHFWQVVPTEYVKYLPAGLSDESEAARA
jgi:glutamate synthase (NADPH/NADH) large chain